MKKVILFGAMFLLPSVVSAQQQLGNLQQLLLSFQRLLNTLIPIIIAIAVVVFLWGVVKFIMNAGDEGKRKDATHKMVWGIVGIVVMVSLWGLVRWVQDAFGVREGSPIDAPQLPPPRP